MKRIIKAFRDGDEVPDNATYLKSFFQKQHNFGTFADRLDILHYFLVDKPE